MVGFFRLNIRSGELEFFDDGGEAEAVAFLPGRGQRVQEADFEVGLVGALRNAKEVHDIALAQRAAFNRHLLR